MLNTFLTTYSIVLGIGAGLGTLLLIIILLVGDVDE